MNSEDYKAGCYYRNKQGVILIGLNMLADSYCKGLVIEENQLKYFQEFSIASIEEITFQEAFTDEIESIVRQYKDALHQCQASHTQISIELERIKTAKEMDSIMNLESDLDYQKKIHEKDINKLNEFHEANSKLKEKADLFLKARNELILKNSDLLGNNNQLREEIENLKIERDQLVIDYDELERKQFDNVIDNNEYAMKAENDSLKKALDKLSDLTVKFYLKSEGITL